MTRVIRSRAGCRVVVAGAVALASLAAPAAASPRAASRAAAVSLVSRGCPGPNFEAVQAVDGRFVYESWIGCGGIGFARSADGGRHFGPPVRVRGSAPPGPYPHELPRLGWDPALAVAPDGTVYVSFMIARGGYAHPVVAASVDHGRTFARVRPVLPPPRYRPNWGDRAYIAVGPDGTVYVTWVYGRHFHPNGGVTYSNVVLQKSTDEGRTWSHLTPVSPGFPNEGAEIAAAPLVVEPSGRIDVLMWVDAPPGAQPYVLSPGHDYFTSSVDGGRTWSRPVRMGPAAFRINPLKVFWIDASIGVDSSGVLYAAWDTQRPGGDIGWLSYSIDHGRTWSEPRAATSSRGDAEHLMGVAGGGPGIAYVGWLTPNLHKGWAQYLRPFSITDGWLSSRKRISPEFGNPDGWPGDTIGLTVLPGGRTGGIPPVMVSWGVPTRTSTQIWAARIAAN